MRTQPKHWLDRTLAPNANGKHDPKGSFRARPVLVKDKNSEEMPGDVAMPDIRPVTGFYSFVTIAGLRVAVGFQFKMEWLSSSHVPPFPKMFGANMGEVIRFIPKSERERARLVREARARYDSIFPPADPAREQRDNTPVSHTVNDSNANRSDGSLVS